MGGYAAQFKAFIDGASGVWFQLGWKDKLAAGFTHSLGLSGDKLDTLIGLVINAMQHGMIWVGPGLMPEGTTPDKINRIASFTGLMAQSNMDQPNIGEGDRKTAVLLGERVAQTAARLVSAPKRVAGQSLNILRDSGDFNGQSDHRGQESNEHDGPACIGFSEDLFWDKSTKRFVLVGHAMIAMRAELAKFAHA